jgi:quercetin dioxygenase-like cupin family protein
MELCLLEDTMTRHISARVAVRLSLAAVFVGTVSFEWMSHAQQPPAGAPQTSANYTGQTSNVDQAGMLPGRRRFERGARSAWHTHPAGQLLFVEEGRLRVRRRGERIKDLGPQESDFTAANVPHWHGATPDSHAIQASLSFGGIGPWLEPVTEPEYLGK